MAKQGWPGLWCQATGFSLGAAGNGVSWHQTPHDRDFGGICFRSNFPYFFALQQGALSAVLRDLEHGKSPGIVTYAQI